MLNLSYQQHQYKKKKEEERRRKKKKKIIKGDIRLNSKREDNRVAKMNIIPKY